MAEDSVISQSGIHRTLTDDSGLKRFSLSFHSLTKVQSHCVPIIFFERLGADTSRRPMGSRNQI